MIDLMRKNRADGIGAGTAVRNHIGYAAWKNMNWREEWAGAKITVHVKMKINNFGKFR